MSTSDEREEIRQTLAQLLDDHAGSAQIRTAMASETGYDAELWRRLGEDLGVGALAVPEDLGGLGLGFADAMVIVEEIGRRLVPGPVRDTMVAAAILAHCDTPVAVRILEEITSGSSVAIAVTEGGRASGRDLDPLDTVAVADGDAYRLTGTKTHVAHGADAGILLIIARDDRGRPALFRTVRDHTARRVMTIDQTRRVAELGFSDTEAHLVAASDRDIAPLLIDSLLVAAAVESAAAAAACLDLTVEYLKVRHQFGKPIGSFQALKHRCADHAVTVHEATVTAAAAVGTVDRILAGAEGGDQPLAIMAPLAKLVCTRALTTVAADAIQLHGGIGFTFEHDAHLYFKRAKVNEHLLGGPSYLRGRLIAALGW